MQDLPMDLAVNAKFSNLKAIAVDKSGNIYVNEDTTGDAIWDKRLREITDSGVETLCKHRGLVFIDGEGDMISAPLMTLNPVKVKMSGIVTDWGSYIPGFCNNEPILAKNWV